MQRRNVFHSCNNVLRLSLKGGWGGVGRGWGGRGSTEGARMERSDESISLGRAFFLASYPYQQQSVIYKLINIGIALQSMVFQKTSISHPNSCNDPFVSIAPMVLYKIVLFFTFLSITFELLRQITFL